MPMPWLLASPDISSHGTDYEKNGHGLEMGHDLEMGRDLEMGHNPEMTLTYLPPPAASTATAASPLLSPLVRVCVSCVVTTRVPSSVDSDTIVRVTTVRVILTEDCVLTTSRVEFSSLQGEQEHMIMKLKHINSFRVQLDKKQICTSSEIVPPIFYLYRYMAQKGWWI